MTLVRYTNLTPVRNTKLIPYFDLRALFVLKSICINAIAAFQVKWDAKIEQSRQVKLTISKRLSSQIPLFHCRIPNRCLWLITSLRFKPYLFDIRKGRLACFGDWNTSQPPGKARARAQRVRRLFWSPFSVDPAQCFDHVKQPRPQGVIAEILFQGWLKLLSWL